MQIKGKMINKSAARCSARNQESQAIFILLQECSQYTEEVEFIQRKTRNKKYVLWTWSINYQLNGTYSAETGFQFNQ